MKSGKGLSAIRRKVDMLFVDREFIMRANGEVRFLNISARLQKRVAGIIVLALAVWAIATLAMIGNQFAVSVERNALSERREEVQTAEQRVAAYRDSIDDVAADIERRQDLIDTLMKSYFDEEVTPAADGSEEAEDELTRKIGAVLPEARHLAALEQRQIIFVSRLNKVATARSAAAADKIRAFGLDPDRIMKEQMSARGGPFLPFFKDKEQVSDPRFTNLAISLERMYTLETALANVPSATPSILRDMSSRFGYRSDPITGRSAMHSGIDFRGANGSPILAAADGVISFAGRKGGYGNAIEIDHGNGIITRYAHLSGIDAKVGQDVTRGAKIGRMGSTGRSTGTHLHFEVRVRGRAVDPMLFLGDTNVQK